MAAKKLNESFSKSLIGEAHRWGCMKQTGVSLRYMMEFGSTPTERNLLISAQFLHRELPIRIARRATELESLPHGLSDKPAVRKVRDWYLDSFQDLRSFPDIKDKNDELEFTKMIKMIKVRHNDVVPTIALGVQQLKKALQPKIDYQCLDEIHQFLDRFYMSRIGIRMLIGQHVELHNPNPPPFIVGYIHTKMSPLNVVRSASEDARSICLREYGSAPEVNICGDPNFTFPYVPTHLHMMVFELVKNSLRAVQERFMDSDKVAPPIRIIVADGLEDVTIKVSDEGGGIARSGLPKIFTYLYSTAIDPLVEQPDLETANVATMAGYGYGLPICRLYAQYFGGDLKIVPMEGYELAGTEAEWIRNLLADIPLWYKPIPSISLHCDSQAAIANAMNHVYNGKQRHIRLRHNIVQGLISNGVISIEFVRSEKNLADPLTKGLNKKGQMLIFICLVWEILKSPFHNTVAMNSQCAQQANCSRPV